MDCSKIWESSIKESLNTNNKNILTDNELEFHLALMNTKVSRANYLFIKIKKSYVNGIIYTINPYNNFRMFFEEYSKVSEILLERDKNWENIIEYKYILNGFYPNHMDAETLISNNENSHYLIYIGIR